MQGEDAYDGKAFVFDCGGSMGYKLNVVHPP